MDTSAIQSFISSLGFPIACCGALFWFINKTLKEFTVTMRNSLAELSKAIDQNTQATNTLVTTVQLISRLEGDEK